MAGVDIKMNVILQEGLQDRPLLEGKDSGDPTIHTASIADGGVEVNCTDQFSPTVNQLLQYQEAFIAGSTRSLAQLRPSPATGRVRSYSAQSSTERAGCGDSISSTERAGCGDSVSSAERAGCGDSVSSTERAGCGESVSSTERAGCGDSVSSTERAGCHRCVRISARWRQWRRAAEAPDAWMILLFSILPINLMMGMDFICFSLYYVAYSQHFPSESRSTIGAIVAIKEIVSCIFGLVTSVLITRYGCVRVTVAGGTLVFLSYILSAFTPSLIMLYATQGLLAGAGKSFCVLAPNYLLHKRFEENRGLAGGMGRLGTTLGNIVGVFFTQHLIQSYGWRGSLALQAALAAHIIPLGLIMVLQKSHSVEDINDENMDQSRISSFRQTCNATKSFCTEMLDFRLFKNTMFILMSFGSMCDRINTFTFMHHMPSRAVYLGMSPADGAVFMSVCTMTVLGCRTAVTFLSNLRSANRVLMYSAGCFVGGLASYVLVALPTYTGQIIGSVLSGIHVGVTNTLTWVTLTDLMGLSTLARAMALLDLFVGVAAFIAAPIGGYVFDRTNSYDPTFIVAGTFNVLGGTLILSAAILDIRRRKTLTTTG